MNFISSSSIQKHNLMTNQSVHGFIIMLVFLFFAATVPFAAGQAAASPSRPRHQYLMVIIMVVLISVFFILGFFLIYVHQWVEVGRTGRMVRPRNGVEERAERGKRGLDLDVIVTFPIVNYSDVKLLKIGKGELECAVCLNEFEDDETLRLLPKCDHVFHPECIDEWLVDHVTCPVCRANLKPEPIDVVVTDDVAAAAAREVSAESDEMNNEVSEVRISVTDEQDAHSEVININQTPIQNCPVRLDSTRIDRKFPRSHSTPILSVRENCERFTLRLPDDVRKRIVTGRLNRTTSFCFASPPTGDGNVKSDRWIFSMAPPFFTRTSSVKSLKVIDGDGSFGGNTSTVFSMAPPFFTRTSSVKSLKVIDGDGSFGGNTSTVFPRGLCNSVKLSLPLDCLGGKGSTDNVRLPV